jgi:propionate CoA-transferase
MNVTEKAGLLLHLLRWRLTWDKRDIDYRPGGLANPKFVSARQAAGKIRDGSVVFSSGMAANMRPSIFFWAVREVFEKTGHPRDLTWIIVGAQGGRGRIPGTIEELAFSGLITRFIAGHLETQKALLRLADQGKVEMHCLPQGIQTFLLEAQTRGEPFVTSRTGVGTFLDPATGPGSYVGGSPLTEPLVETDPAGLRYRMPGIDCSLFVAPCADEDGNLYMRHACMHTETRESSLAARRNGGLVIASVAEIVPRKEEEIYLAADQVDFIVVNPRSEQTGSVPQRRYWKMFTTEHRVDTHDSVERLKFVNRVLKITPVRTPVELAVARLAASLFTRVVRKGALVNIGVGLGEEVCRLVYEGGLHEEVTFFTETGVLGGLPAPGIFFGTAINPRELMTSAQIFHRAYEKLDATVLGFLEVDSEGSVNVSRRGPGMMDVVGTGGLPDLAAAARSILFVGSWMANAHMEIADGKIRIARPGSVKFMEKVSEITFSGPQALAAGKNVYYATSVGLFQLTPQGMMLREVMPGIDIRRDILDACPMRIVLPESGDVPRVPAEIVTGHGFRLSF